MRGLPKSYIKKWGVSKRAWREYRKVHPKRKSKSKASKPKTKSKKRKTTSKKGGRRMGGKNLQTTVFKWLRIAALVGPGVSMAVTPGRSTEAKVSDILSIYTGYSIEQKNFQMERLATGWTPFLMATLATYGIPKIAGIIRRL